MTAHFALKNECPRCSALPRACRALPRDPVEAQVLSRAQALQRQDLAQRVRLDQDRARPRVCCGCACAAHCSTRGFSMRTACGCRPRTLLPSGQRLERKHRQDSLAFRGAGALARDLPVAGHKERRRPRQGMMVLLGNNSKWMESRRLILHFTLALSVHIILANPSNFKRERRTIKLCSGRGCNC